MLFSLGGNLETAFALPAVYSNQFPLPSNSEDGSVTEYPDGGWFEYEPETGRWYVRGIKSLVIEAEDNVTFKTGEFVVEADTTRINSEVVINGGVIHNGSGEAIGFRTRNGDSKTWNPWYALYHSGNKPTAADVAALPLAGRSAYAPGYRNANQRSGHRSDRRLGR